MNKDLNLFRKIIDRTSDAIYVIDPETCKFLEINEAAYKLLGYTQDELLAKRVIDISATDDNINKWRQGIEYLRTVPYQIFEGEQIHKNGSLIPVEVNVSLITLDNKEYIISVARDIRDRKRDRDAVIKEKNKLKAAITALGDGLTMQDRQFRIIYQNEAHKEKQGDRAGEFCYQAYQGLDQICEGCLLVLCFKDGKTHRRETSIITTDGKKIYLEVSASPVRNAQGEIYAGIETVRDITSRKLLEQKVAKHQKLDSIGVLAGGIAHDFNNMLAAILGNISLANLNLPKNSKSHKLLLEAEKACNIATTLTQQLLTFSKGGAPITKTAAISSLIIESVKFTLRGSKVRGDTTSVPADLWPVEVDEGQINQVIQNLTKNAEQAMPQGGNIYLSAENIILDSDTADSLSLMSGKYIKITLRDEGVGIAPNELSQIFDPYFTTKKTGNGLGLAVCYSIIKNHHGVINVDSKEGKGTIFTLYLPVSNKKLAVTQKEITNVATEKKEARILLMDDDEMVQAVSMKLMEHLGYRVEQAKDGEEAIALFSEAKASGDDFDAVILDLTVPGGMGGLETMTHLLEIDQGVKGIVSSGYANDPIMANYSKYGFSAVIPKPFTIEDLNKILHQVIS